MQRCLTNTISNFRTSISSQSRRRWATLLGTQAWFTYILIIQSTCFTAWTSTNHSQLKQIEILWGKFLDEKHFLATCWTCGYQMQYIIVFRGRKGFEKLKVSDCSSYDSLLFHLHLMIPCVVYVSDQLYIWMNTTDRTLPPDKIQTSAYYNLDS